MRTLQNISLPSHCALTVTSNARSEIIKVTEKHPLRRLLSSLLTESLKFMYSQDMETLNEHVTPNGGHFHASSAPADDKFDAVSRILEQESEVSGVRGKLSFRRWMRPADLVSKLRLRGIYAAPAEVHMIAAAVGFRLRRVMINKQTAVYLVREEDMKVVGPAPRVASGGVL